MYTSSVILVRRTIGMLYSIHAFQMGKFDVAEHLALSQLPNVATLLMESSDTEILTI